MRFGFIIEWLTIAAGTLLLAYILFAEPLIGIADSGDFLRIATTVGLSDLDANASYEDQYFGYFHSQYRYSPISIGGYFSTQIAIVFIAIGISKLFNPQLFDIRFLAAIYCMLLLTAFYLLMQLKLLSSLAAKLTLAAVLLFVFVDVGYTAYFNSLYGEPLSLVFLLLTLAFALRMLESADNRRKRWLIAFFAAAIILVGSKVQNAPVGLILCFLSLRFLNIRGDYKWRRLTLIFTAMLLLVSTAIYISAPKEFRVINQYQSVFYGILKDSPHPEKNLADMGLDPKLSVLAGTNYFTPNTPIPQQSDQLKEAFYSKISHGKIAVFYLTHPSRFINKLEAAASNTLHMRPSYLGNYEKSAGYPRGAISPVYAAWSNFKEHIMPHTLWFLIPFFGLYKLILIRAHRKETSGDRKKAYEVLMSIGLIAAVAFVVPLVGDGEADMHKHLFLFNVCFDVVFVTGVVWLVHQAVKWIRVRATYGKYMIGR